jgi:hypothetical protein
MAMRHLPTSHRPSATPHAPQGGGHTGLHPLDCGAAEERPRARLAPGQLRRGRPKPGQLQPGARGRAGAANAIPCATSARLGRAPQPSSRPCRSCRSTTAPFSRLRARPAATPNTQEPLSQMSALASGGGVSLLQELAGMLRRALTQQAPVREALYSGIGQVGAAAAAGAASPGRAWGLLQELIRPCSWAQAPSPHTHPALLGAEPHPTPLALRPARFNPPPPPSNPQGPGRRPPLPRAAVRAAAAPPGAVRVTR